MLFAGRLRHKIDIVNVSSVQDSTGGQSLSANVVYANVWASIEALTGTEKFAAHEFVSQVSHQCVIRWIGPAPSWVALNDYPGSFLIVDANRNFQQAQTPGGLSGAVAPVWNTTPGGFTSDGDPSTGLTWKNLGPAGQRTGVNSGMQIWFQGRTFQVEAVLNADERNKSLILLCIEINDSLQTKPSPAQPGDLT
jgi:head-tail adaptor